MAVISKNVRILRCAWSQAFGLMFRWPRRPFAYVFPFKHNRKVAITMWFVFYPIDVVFLDAQNHVVELVARLLPFSHYFPKYKARSFIEFPAGTIARHGLRVGQKLSWSDDSVKSH